MTQNEELCLNDYQARQKVERQVLLDAENEVFRIQNQAMRTVLDECPEEFQLRTPADCVRCGNENCVKAWKEQNKLWNEPEDQKLPVSVANTTGTGIPARDFPLSALVEKTIQQCQPLTQHASGSNLFDRMQNDEEKAA